MALTAAATVGLKSARGDLSGFGGFAPVNTYVSNAPSTGTTNGYTSGTTFKINDGAGNEATSGFGAAAQDVSSFTATFTYQVTGSTSTATTQFGLGDGFDFVIQNDSRGAAAVGGGGGSKGYANSGTGSPNAVGPSAAVSFEVYNGNTTALLNTPSGSQTTTTTGQQNTYVNGGFTGAHNLPAITSGDPINVTLSYSGGTLTELLFDTTTRGTFYKAYNNVSLPSLVGGSTALVGFTGGTGGAAIAQQVSNFQFTSTHGAAFTPIPLTAASFTQDAVLSASEVAAATTAGAMNLSAGVTATVDGGTAKTGDTFYELGSNPTSLTTGLPVSGSVLSTPGHTFQLQSYTANNVLLVNNASSGTLAFAAPQAESVLSLLLSAGNGPAPLSLTVNYLNGTTATIANVLAPDWFYTDTSAAIAGGRVNVGSTGLTGFETNGSNPNIYQVDVPLTDTLDPISSVTVNYTGTNTGTQVLVFGLSGNNGQVPEPASVATLAGVGVVALLRRRRAAVTVA